MITEQTIHESTRELQLVELMTQRITLNEELRGSVRIGDGRSRETIVEELRSVETEIRARCG